MKETEGRGWTVGKGLGGGRTGGLGNSRGEFLGQEGEEQAQGEHGKVKKKMNYEENA